MSGKPPLVHAMIDAGMMPSKARNMPLTEKGVKLLFSRPKGGLREEQPLSASVRWQPVFLVEIDQGKVSQVMDLDEHLFVGNPVMPVF